jgi:hypothetical protein
MNQTDPRAAASIALRNANDVYRAAVAEATQAEDTHAQAESTLALRGLDWSEHVERTGAALSIANRAVKVALAERNRLYDIYLDLSAASKA